MSKYLFIHFWIGLWRKQVLEYQIVQIYVVHATYLCKNWNLCFDLLVSGENPSSFWLLWTSTGLLNLLLSRLQQTISHPWHLHNWQPQLPSAPWKMSVLWQAPLIWSLPQLLWSWWTLSAQIWLKLGTGWPRDNTFDVLVQAILGHLCLCNA